MRSVGLVSNLAEMQDEVIDVYSDFLLSVEVTLELINRFISK